MKHTKKYILKKREDHVDYDEAEELQKELIEIYKKEYKPKHKKWQYFDLIMDYGIDEIEESHPQDTNYHEYVYECFSVVSQHVHGYTKEHCLDQIWDAVQRKKKRIREYKKLPTLDQLVNSKKKIDPEAIEIAVINAEQNFWKLSPSESKNYVEKHAWIKK